MNHIEDSGIESLVRLKEGGSKIIAILIQSAKTNSLLNRSTDRAFENRRSRYKELGKKVPQAYRVYVEDSFLPCDAGDARIFSKEETGLYYYGARYLDPKYSRWLSGDPALGEYIPAAGEDISKLPAGGIFNVISFNVFNYANNNPIKYTDPSGRNPVYDTEGNLIGVTENSGLQGDAFIMNKEDYDAKMTLDDARDKNLGINGLNGQEALDKFNESFASLKDRPDWDAILTLEEANDWYKNGNGQELFVDINQIDLSMLLSLGDKYIGEKYVFNLFILGSKDGKVYGSLTFVRYPNDTCRAFVDKYDFDMKSWRNPLNWVRNIATIAGNVYAGKGVPYDINIYGSAQLKRKK